MADPIDNIVSVNIVVTSAAPTRKSFGIPLIMAYHTHNTDRVRTYNNLPDMVADGFTTVEPAYYMAQAIVSQNPRPPQFKVGRLTTAVAQTYTFQVTDTNVGDKVGLTVTSPLGVSMDAHHTVIGGDTTTSIATAVAVLLNGGAVTASSSADVVTATVNTAGNIWYPSNIFGGVFLENTPSASYQTDLAAIRLVDDQFYGIGISLFSAANIQAVAAFTEANQKIFAYNSADTNNAGTPPSGIFGTLKGLGYKRSFGLFSGSPIQYSAVGLLAQRLTADPGSDTWAYKTIAGASPDTLTSTQEQNINNVTGVSNNGNYYTTVAGINGVIDGRSAQGQYMDIQRGLDALQNDIQTRVWALLASQPKVPYTAKGIESVASQVRASLASFTATASNPLRFLSGDSGFEPTVLVPKLADVNPLDKAQRILRNLNFTATATGAVQTVLINGTINF